MIVWDNTLVDGHNRYAIFRNIPKSAFSTMPLRFENREEARLDLQESVGAAQPYPGTEAFLLGKQYEAEKKAKNGNNQYTLTTQEAVEELCHNDNHHSAEENPASGLQSENGVSESYVPRSRSCEALYRGIDIADTLSPGIQQKVFSGK